MINRLSMALFYLHSVSELATYVLWWAFLLMSLFAAIMFMGVSRRWALQGNLSGCWRILGLFVLTARHIVIFIMTNRSSENLWIHRASIFEIRIPHLIVTPSPVEEIRHVDHFALESIYCSIVSDSQTEEILSPLSSPKLHYVHARSRFVRIIP